MFFCNVKMFNSCELKKSIVFSEHTKSIHIPRFTFKNEEHGNPVHRGTQKKLRKEGIPCGNHRARKMCREEYAAFDYIICMERYNIQNIMRIIGNDPEHKVQRLLDYTNRPRDIADPWYTGNFDETFDDVMEGCQAFLSYLMEHLQ